ncbi:PP2C family protein-serine/threonine phosphatase [Streptomyces sp. NPDC048002]|uniref:PP2C family protein-serine/threonine phosphatase n=1 Tax=Streptomyces sp. NPDC048002 TaxID=3154344 RepID=UPI0033FA2139
MIRIKAVRPRRPPAPRVAGLSVAAAHLAADRGARAGGDLYDVVATEHGVRVVMGDVRGHGTAAVGAADALLDGFRDAVHDEPDLGRILRRLERAQARHLRARAADEHPEAEEFATVLLLEIGEEGTVRGVNCGHPWPYLMSGTSVEPLTAADPLPPLGMFPLPCDPPVVHAGRLLPGEALVLYTDGAEDARDTRGRFFSLHEALGRAVRTRPGRPQLILRSVLRALTHHAPGTPSDDIALLILRNDRTHPIGARRTARPPGTPR